MNIDSITFNGDPDSNIELANKKHDYDSIGEGNALRFTQTPKNHLSVLVGNDICNLTEYDKIQVLDKTIISYANHGDFLLQKWIIY